MTEKNYLIAGGYGFIGSCFVRKLLEDKNNSICNIDKLSYASTLDSISYSNDDKYIFENIDIFESNKVRRIIHDFKPDFIINFAAETHVDRSIDDPDQFIKSNINGTFNLLEQGYQFWKELPSKAKNSFRFLQVSTDEVYGSLGKNDKQSEEEDSYNPNSPYSASKAASDHLVRSWFKTYTFPTIITNTCNNYGPWQFPEKLIPLVINKCLNNEKIPVYGDGTQIRDWIRVEDHISGINTVLTKGNIGEKYNIGAECELTNIKVVTDICRILDDVYPHADCSYEELIEFVTDRPGHDFRYAINNNKIKSLGWTPSYSWEVGIRETINWYLSNREFLNSIMKQNYSGERLGKV